MTKLSPITNNADQTYVHGQLAKFTGTFFENVHGHF